MAENTLDTDSFVRDFCAAWQRMDPDELLTFFAPDATYHNVPLEPATGPEAIRAVIEGFAAMAQSIEFEILNQVSAGNLIMNERIDTIVMGENTVALPVMGVFEMEDGLIKRWSDYFDMGQFSGA